MEYCYYDYVNQSVKTKISNCCCEQTQNDTEQNCCNNSEKND